MQSARRHEPFIERLQMYHNMMVFLFAIEAIVVLVAVVLVKDDWAKYALGFAVAGAMSLIFGFMSYLVNNMWADPSWLQNALMMFGAYNIFMMFVAMFNFVMLKFVNRIMIRKTTSN